MKKIIYEDFGTIDILMVTESEAPTLKKNEVLIQVRAVSMNPLDLNKLSRSSRLMSGNKFPKMIGIDFSGIISKVDNDNLNFKVGDEVFGAVKDPMKEGVLAEYIAIDSEQITLKPQSISFSQASAMTSVGAPALKALEEKILLKKGQKVLINGASGGVGMIAIQVAKRAGAIVTAVSSSDGTSFTKQWGADVVVDYKKENITELEEKFDVVFELSSTLSYLVATKIMKENSSFITLMGASSMKNVATGMIRSFFSKQKFYVLIAPATLKIRERLVDYVENGLKIHIQKTYPINDVQIAYSEFQKNSTIGKSVITI